MEVMIKVNHKPNTKFDKLQGIATRKLQDNYSFKEAESLGRVKTKENGDKRVSHYKYKLERS